MTAMEIRPTGNYVKQWMVGSHTDPDKEYKVSQTEDGNWKCGCPRWIFGKPRKDCKHILGLKGEEPVDQVRTFGRVVSKEPVYLAPKPGNKAVMDAPGPVFVLQTKRMIRIA